MRQGYNECEGASLLLCYMCVRVLKANGLMKKCAFCYFFVDLFKKCRIFCADLKFLGLLNMYHYEQEKFIEEV